MPAQICPVCGGKGLVPNGFYDMSSNIGNIRKTVSTSPETCRSCQGKGYIIEYPEYNQVPVHNGFKSCSMCNKNDGMCYMSNRLVYKCVLDGEFHIGDYFCDDYEPQEIVKNYFH